MSDNIVIFRIFQIIKPYRNRLILAMVSMVAVAGLSAMQAYMVKPLLDEIFFKKDRLMLNLLPLPVLDGGHLMYYLWEGVTGRPVSEAWLERLQRGGVAILMALMAVALFNDVARLAG